jgi:hypothetical protein
MRRFWTLILSVSLSGLALPLSAQQPQEPGNPPSSQQPLPPADQPGSQQQQPPANQPGSQPQQPPAAQPGSQPDTQQPAPPADQPGSQPQATTAGQPSPETFKGKISRSGNQLVFQEAKSETTFPVDDQTKVAPFEGKSVKVTATIDSKTNGMHVIDISPSDK